MDAFYEFRGRKARTLTVLISVAIILLFTFGFVWINIPLNVFASNNKIEYPQGTIIGGLHWNSKFADLRIQIENPTSFDYQDINITVRPDEPVAVVGQVTNLPGVSIVDRSSLFMVSVELSTGKRNSLPVIFVATSAGYRVQCEKLLAGTRIELVMAAVTINMSLQDILHVNLGDFTHSWFTNKSTLLSGDADVYGTRPTPSLVHVEGQYTALQRKLLIKEDIQVGDFIGEGLKKSLTGK